MSERGDDRNDRVGQGEFPGDRHGAGSAERGRDRNAGVGGGGFHEGADVPSESIVGGQQSASEGLNEIMDAIQARPPRRGPDDQTSDPDDVPPPREDTEPDL